MPYIEDFHEGQVFRTAARTIFMHDITAFAQLSGDWHPLHTDEEFARQSIHGGLIAHGTLVLCAATGLLARAGMFDDKAMAFLGVEWSIAGAVRPGDTIRVEATVTNVRVSRSKPDRGVVEFAFEVLNGRDEVVARASWTNMFRTRDEPDTSSA